MPSAQTLGSSEGLLPRHRHDPRTSDGSATPVLLRLKALSLKEDDLSAYVMFPLPSFVRGRRDLRVSSSGVDGCLIPQRDLACLACLAEPLDFPLAKDDPLRLAVHSARVQAKRNEGG